MDFVNYSEEEPEMRLFTNLNYATIWRRGDPVRTNVSAVLLEVPLGFSTERDPEANGRVRGCGPDGAWPVFDLALDCKWSEYEMRDAEDRSVLFLGDSDEEPRPISSGATLRWKDETTIYLTVEDESRPLDIEDLDDDGYPEVWEMLRRKATDYWTAPNMPTLQYLPAAILKA